MKKLLLSIFLTITLVSSNLEPRRRGNGFAGGLVGGLFGGILSSAIISSSNNSSRATEATVAQTQQEIAQIKREREDQRLQELREKINDRERDIRKQIDQREKELENRYIGQNQNNILIQILLFAIAMLFFIIIGLGLLIIKKQK